LRPKCFFCDASLEVVTHTYKVGLRDEPVCEECYTKTVNRKRVKDEEPSR
jgi:hypothetical protein